MAEDVPFTTKRTRDLASQVTTIAGTPVNPQDAAQAIRGLVAGNLGVAGDLVDMTYRERHGSVIPEVQEDKSADMRARRINMPDEPRNRRLRQDPLSNYVRGAASAMLGLPGDIASLMEDSSVIPEVQEQIKQEGLSRYDTDYFGEKLGADTDGTAFFVGSILSPENLPGMVKGVAIGGAKLASMATAVRSDFIKSFGAGMKNIFSNQAQNRDEYAEVLQRMSGHEFRSVFIDPDFNNAVSLYGYDDVYTPPTINEMWNNGINNLAWEDPTLAQMLGRADLFNLSADSQIQGLSITSYDTIPVSPEIRDWTRGGVYTRGNMFGPEAPNPEHPYVWWHGEKNVHDPSILDHRDIIQFRTPREMGMHMGSFRTSSTFVLPGGLSLPGGVSTAARDILQESPEWGSYLKALQNIEAQQRDVLNLPTLIGKEQYQVLKEAFEYGVALGGGQYDAQAAASFLRDVYKSGRIKPIPKEALNKFHELFRAHNRAMTNTEQAMPSLNAYYTRLERGLLLPDYLGNWAPEDVYRKMRGLDEFEDYADKWESMLYTPDLEKAIWDSIYERGYDHIVYVNRLEGPGDLSVIVRDPEKIKPVMSFSRRAQTSRSVATAMAGVAAMSSVFIVQDEDVEYPEDATILTEE